MTDKERFWSKVDLSGECWVWTGTKAGGYGRFYLNRRMMPAHRYSWTVAKEREERVKDLEEVAAWAKALAKQARSGARGV